MAKSVKINPELMDPEKYDENKIKESAETLLEADEIKKDGVLMSKIQDYWDKQDDKISSLRDLKDASNEYTNNLEVKKPKNKPLKV